MPTLELDKIEGARFEQDGTVKRAVRAGLARDIDTSDKAAALYRVLQISGCPQFGHALSGVPDVALQRIQVIPLAGDIARILFVYESFQAGGPPSAYIITSRSFPRTVTTNKLLGTNERLDCLFEVPAAPGSEKRSELIRDAVTMNVFAPMRGIQVTQLVYGDPDPGTDAGNYICHVNNATWFGKDVGYWMLTEFNTSIAKYQGYYTREAMALSKVLEDWSETGILRNTMTGRYVEADPVKIATAMGRPYKRGFIYPDGVSERYDGFIRVGHYPMINFNAVFGF